MNLQKYLFSFSILSFSLNSYGMTISCNSPEEIDELVSNESFKLQKKGETSHGINFQVELASEIDGLSLNTLVLFKKTEGQAEYFFYLKVVENDKKYTTAFTLGKENIEGAELTALYKNEDGLCTSKVRRYRTEL